MAAAPSVTLSELEPHIERAIRRSQRRQLSLAVFSVQPLDAVHGAGSAVGSAELLARLRRGVRDYDIVVDASTEGSGGPSARALVMCEDLEGFETAKAIAQRLAVPSSRDGDSFHTDAFVGIAFLGSREVPASTLVEEAHAACERAMVERSKVEFFHPELTSAARAGSAAEERLERALEHDELELFYQPKVEVLSGRLAGFEALIRWRHPERGLVPPMEFIPLAESSGLIAPIGAWVLQDACRQVSAWRRDNFLAEDATLSVNVSAAQFDPRLADTVSGALESSGLPADTLTLELTESTLMSDVGSAIETLRALKATGVGLSIDDFGTGYSSLAYLKRLPVDELKIDRSFVSGLGTDPEDTAIVGAVIALAHALDLTVVAEGTETAQHVEELKVLGCELAQGYFFAPPVAPDELATILRTGFADTGGGLVVSYPQRPAVIVADDAADVRQLASVSLATAGFEVHEAASGPEALALARSIRPACVVLDLTMPGQGGLEVCAALRADAALSGCAILILTSRRSTDDKVAAFTAGADDYFVKPFGPRELVRRVRAALAERMQAADQTD